MSLTRRWAALVFYVAVIYTTLPFGPRLGLRVLRTAPGGWLLGAGLPFLALATAGGLVALLRRRGAPPWAYAALLGAGAAYAYVFTGLRAHHLERTHLPEYGLAAFLAWRAVHPLVRGELGGYAAAAILAAAIGWGDELLQSVTPGRYYDIRDVALNAVGAVLGVVVLAAARAGRGRHKAVVFGESAEIATPRSAR